MLLELAVTDLALLERVRVAFGGGFTVITGETGAGKSLLIDALGLIVGERADTTLVRSGAALARVEALFDRAPEPLICVRELSAAGRSVARIDDETVTVARLAATTAPLVEVHGQHEQGRLLSSAWQRELLDAFGGHGELTAAVAAAFEAWRDNEAALRDLELAPDELARRIELHEHAASEIESVAPRPGEVADLRARLSAQHDAERLTRLTAAIYERLRGDGTAARDGIAAAARDAGELARIDARMAPLAARIEGLAAEIDDIAAEVRRYAEESLDDGATVAGIEDRLGLLYGLFRKYGDDEAAVLAHGERARTEVDRLRGLETERAARRARGDALRVALEEAAATLGRARRDAAGRLGAEVTRSLVELGFPEASFDVAIDAAELGAAGSETVTFLLAPNAGEPPRPLARIASGGELSRVALAIKGVLASADSTPTLVFDEVDAGIGGRSADPVGRSLWRLARDHQVICVTHLPQIAAYADAHLRIAKETRGGRTVTVIAELDDDERVDELAAMLGGVPGDATSRAAAAELRSRAAASRHGTASVA
jgi:DNA repair protein RecN (Recombination protein N)